MIDVSAFAKTLNNKPVAVFGLARSGLSTIRAFKSVGADVIAWDDKPESREEAEKLGASLRPLDENVLRQCGVLILTPGVPFVYKPHPVVVAAKAAGLEIICDIEIFYRCRPKHLKIVGITGTNGKSTTTALLGHVLNESGRPAVIGGNIGAPVLDMNVDLPIRVAVLELSSYQLDLCPKFSPDIAIILNITPDHLDRHGTIENYIAAKEKIFRGPGVAVIAADDNYTLQILSHVKDVGEREIFPVSMNGTLSNTGTLKGKHNHQNMAAVLAAATSKVLGRKKEDILKAFETFPGLPHRQFAVRTINGITYINDSKATNAEAAGKALASHDLIYWIAGGRPKEGGLNGLEPLIKHVKHVFLIGEAAPDFAVWLTKNKIPHTLSGTLESATRAAHVMAQKNAAGVVLLSPACASFDQFKSFEERGDRFAAIVNDLKDIAA